MFWFWLIVAILVLTFGLVVFRGAPYVPSRKKYIKPAFYKLYRLDSNDVLVDIGSGDGIVLREAAKMGARAIGYEINPILVLISRFLSRKYNQVDVRLADFWLSRLPDDTTVVYVFAVSRDTKKILKWVQTEVDRLGRDIYLISYGSQLNLAKPVKCIDAYSLYVFRPLQSDKPQV